MPEVIGYFAIRRMILPEGWVEEPARPEPQLGELGVVGAMRVFHPPPTAFGEPFSGYDPAQVSLTLYSPAPPQNLGDALVLKLLTERPHRLTVKEASSLKYYIFRTYPPNIHWQDIRTDVWNQRMVLMAEGIDANRTDAVHREWVMLVDNRSDIRIPRLEEGRSYSQGQLAYPDLHTIGYYTPAELDRLLGVNQPEFVPRQLPGLVLPLYEISYTAPDSSYASLLPQVMQALRTIEWKEQISRAGQATIYHPVSFLLPGAPPPPPPPPPGQATTRRPVSFLRRLLGKGR